MHLYAIIKTGGREYRVTPGKTVKFERVEAEPGETIEFGEVYTLVNGDQTVIGEPIIEGARVRAQVVKHGQKKGIIVFRMKRRRLYRKKNEHQRQFTSIRINEIIFGNDVFGKRDTDPKKMKKAIAAAKANEQKKTPVSAPRQPEIEPRVRPVLPPIKASTSTKQSSTENVVVKKVQLPKYEQVAVPSGTDAPQKQQTKHQTKHEDKSKGNWLVATIVLLALLVLIAFFWNQKPSPKIGTSPVTEVKPDIRLQETGAVDRPSNPAQPPD